MRRKMTLLALAATLVLGTVGAGTQTAEAKSKAVTVKSVDSLTPETVLYDAKSDTNILRVEAGNAFYMGDLIQAGITYSNGLSSTSYLTGMDATYTSSDETVCSVNEKTGLVTPESKGTAKIRAKYKKQTADITVKVAAKGSFKCPGAKTREAAKKLAAYSKVYTGTFNKKNAKKMLKAALKCKDIVTPYYYKDYTAARFAVETGFGADTKKGQAVQNNKLLYPGCVHYHAMDTNLNTEIYIKYNPFGRHTANPATIQSVSAAVGSSQATITLSRKVTALEYLMLRYGGDFLEDGKPMVGIYTACSDEPNYCMWTEGPVPKDSNQITVTMKYAADNKDFNIYSPDDTTATAANQQLAKKLTTFRKGITYLFCTDAGFDDNGTLTYEAKENSWTDNYRWTVQ